MGSLESIGETINNVTMNNVFKQSLNNNDHCMRASMWKTHRVNHISAGEAETKAAFLVQRLNAPQCRKFFLKCIYHLSEADIQNALEASTRPGVICSARYFNRICKIKLTQRGL